MDFVCIGNSISPISWGVAVKATEKLIVFERKVSTNWLDKLHSISRIEYYIIFSFLFREQGTSNFRFSCFGTISSTTAENSKSHFRTDIASTKSQTDGKDVILLIMYKCPISHPSSSPLCVNKNIFRLVSTRHAHAHSVHSYPNSFLSYRRYVHGRRSNWYLFCSSRAVLNRPFFLYYLRSIFFL